MCSSLISISNNFAKRNYGHTFAVKVSADSVTWLAVIASVYFVISTFEPTYIELTTETSVSKKFWRVLQNITSLGQVSGSRQYQLFSWKALCIALLLIVASSSFHRFLKFQIICIMWLAGSITYAFALYGNILSLPPRAIAQLWIVGGSCYLAGGLLAVSTPNSLLRDIPYVSHSILHNLHHLINHSNAQILCTFKETFEKIYQIQNIIAALDELVAARSYFQPQELDDSFSGIDDISNVSIMTDVLNDPKAMKSPLHRRMRSDHHTSIIGSGFNGHKRTPSSPAVLVGFRFPTINEDDTLQSRTLFDSVTQFNTYGGVQEESIFLGKDILITKHCNALSEHEQDGYIMYTSLGTTCDFDTFVHVLNDMVNVKVDNVTEKVASEKKESSIFIKTCKALMTFPSFYTSLLYAIAGAFYTIGALNTGLSVLSVQNLYLSASCLYLGGSACSLHQAIIVANREWNLSQSSRCALQKMLFFDE